MPTIRWFQQVYLLRKDVTAYGVRVFPLRNILTWSQHSSVCIKLGQYQAVIYLPQAHLRSLLFPRFIIPYLKTVDDKDAGLEPRQDVVRFLVSSVKKRNAKESSPPKGTFAELVNLCIEITHHYRCGHTAVDKTPCAVSKREPCGVLNKRTVRHDTKCFNCGGG